MFKKYTIEPYLNPEVVYTMILEFMAEIPETMAGTRNGSSSMLYIYFI